MRSTWSILATWNTDEFAERPDVLVALLDVVQAAERLTTDAGYAYSNPAEVPQTFLVAIESAVERLRDVAVEPAYD